MVAKFFVSLFAVVLSTLLTIWVMISGWGLSAQSWAVIIWAAVLQFVLITVLTIVNKDDK